MRKIYLVFFFWTTSRLVLCLSWRKNYCIQVKSTVFVGFHLRIPIADSKKSFSQFCFVANWIFRSTHSWLSFPLDWLWKMHYALTHSTNQFDYTVIYFINPGSELAVWRAHSGEKNIVEPIDGHKIKMKSFHKSQNSRGHAFLINFYYARFGKPERNIDGHSRNKLLFYPRITFPCKYTFFVVVYFD